MITMICNETTHAIDEYKNKNMYIVIGVVGAHICVCRREKRQKKREREKESTLYECTK